MIHIENRELFGKVIAESLVRIDQNTEINSLAKMRWINAIAKASARMESNDFFMDYDREAETMLIWNFGTNNLQYETNGKCQCKAYLASQPCWHVASKQLYKRYLEAENAPQLTPNQEMDNAIYMKPEIQSKKLGGFRL